MFLCAFLAWLTPIGAPASAQTTPSYCTATVYVDPGLGINAENAQLRQATNLLSERGIDARILLLEDLDGAAEVKEYERTILARDCPDLIQTVGDRLTRKRDLFMVILAIPMREKGAVFGDNPAGNIHSEALFSDVANPYLRRGSDNNDPSQFATGVLAYFEELDKRLGGNNQGAPAAPQSEPADTGESFNWALLLVVMGITAGLMVLVTLIFLIHRALQAARSRRLRKAELQVRLDAARTSFQELALQTDMDMLQLGHWIDKLPDSDDGELKALKACIDTAIAEGHYDLDTAAGALASAKSHDNLDDAEIYIGEAEATIGAGTKAKREAKPLFEELKAKAEAFPQRQAGCEQLSVGILQLLGTLEKNGFRTQSFAQQHVSCVEGIQQAAFLHGKGAIVSATDLIEAQELTLIELKAALEKLPAYQEQLVVQASKLLRQHAELYEQIKPAEALVSDLAGRYHPSDTDDLPTNLQEAVLAFNDAGANIGKAQQAASMQTQQFDIASDLLEQAGRQLRTARSGIASVRERERELEVLPGKLDKLRKRLMGSVGELQEYIETVREDIDPAVATRANNLHRQAQEAFRHVDTSQPALRQLKDELDNLKREVDDCLRTARDQYQAAEYQVTVARSRAEARLDDARRYRSYSDGRFDRANDGFFTGALVGMTLQQQLNHWHQAERAAGSAYDYGRDNQPSYSSSSSSSSDGGSSSSSWSSPSFDSGSDSGGGSSSSDW
jgi:uncharacterized membrane protein YgcG